MIEAQPHGLLASTFETRSDDSITGVSSIACALTASQALFAALDLSLFTRLAGDPIQGKSARIILRQAPANTFRRTGPSFAPDFGRISALPTFKNPLNQMNLAGTSQRHARSEHRAPSWTSEVGCGALASKDMRRHSARTTLTRLSSRT